MYKSAVVQIRMEPSLRERLAIASEALERPTSELLRAAISAYLKRLEKTEPQYGQAIQEWRERVPKPARKQR